MSTWLNVNIHITGIEFKIIFFRKIKQGLQQWCPISEKVVKFIGCCNQICGRNQIGLSDQDKILDISFSLCFNWFVTEDLYNWARGNWPIMLKFGIVHKIVALSFLLHEIGILITIWLIHTRDTLICFGYTCELFNWFFEVCYFAFIEIRKTELVLM